jgi:hypothetical protein
MGNVYKHYPPLFHYVECYFKKYYTKADELKSPVSTLRPKEKLHQRKPARHRQQKRLFPSRRSLLHFLVLARRARFLVRHDHRRIFREVYTALVACPAVPLRSPARRALVQQRRVAALAELRRVRIRRLALGAFHALILLRATRAPGLAEPPCVNRATCSLVQAPPMCNKAHRLRNLCCYIQRSYIH